MADGTVLDDQWRSIGLKFKQEVKAALADGKITGEEKEQLKASFGKLEPGEQHRAIHALAQHGHQRLAMALGQG